MKAKSLGSLVEKNSKRRVLVARLAGSAVEFCNFRTH